jgi:thiol-disulfide isomerase/thioredoxin
MSKPQRNPARTWVLIALGFALLWVLYLALFGPRRPALLENSGLSQPADYDWPLFDLNDNPVTFAQFKGKPVFLNIWATWCGPCVEEMPSIARLAQDPRLTGKGLEFVCVSVDDSSGAVRRFVRGQSWRMTFLRADRLPGVFSTGGIPATFVIAADGRIVACEVGAAQWDVPGVVTFLEKTAAPAPPPPKQRVP